MDGVFPNAVPGSAVEIMHAWTEAFVLARVWLGHNPLRCVVVQTKSSLISYHILLRAGIWHTVNDKNRGGPQRKIGGGLPE